MFFLQGIIGSWKNDSRFLGKRLSNWSDVDWTLCGPTVYVWGVVCAIPSGKWESGGKLAQEKKNIPSDPLGVVSLIPHVKLGVNPQE